MENVIKNHIFQENAYSQCVSAQAPDNKPRNKSTICVAAITPWLWVMVEALVEGKLYVYILVTCVIWGL